MATKRRTIRVGQRLVNWDGGKAYVALSFTGNRNYATGESFLVEFIDEEGQVEGAEYYTLAELETEGITFGRGVMPWAR